MTTVIGPRQDGATGSLAEPQNTWAGQIENRPGSWVNVSPTRTLSQAIWKVQRVVTYSSFSRIVRSGYDLVILFKPAER
jgi:hypothetical protein